MIKISLPRGSGKTTKLIKKAAEGSYYIICSSVDSAYMIAEQARKLKLEIPFPLTYDEFDRNQYYGKNIKGFLFDDLDEYIQSKTRVPIIGVTLTKE